MQSKADNLKPVVVLGQEHEIRPILLAAGIFAALSVWAAVKSQGFLEADACTHYLYARFAIAEPHYFANVWGRPLCTALYALPAALAGRVGARVVSMWMALACALVAWRIAKGQGYRWPALALVFTLAQPLVFLHSFSVLTELPFALLIGLAFWMYQKRWWGAMAALTALSPLGRPEGFGFVLLAGLALVLHRRWGWLVVLPLPLILWSLAGWELFGRAGQWWMWLPENWPYQAESLYKSGYLIHFLVLMPVVTSPVMFPALVIGVWDSLRSFVARRAGSSRVRSDSGVAEKFDVSAQVARCQALIAVVPLLIFVGHSTLYWLGKMSSNGELRYMLVVAPFWGLLIARGWEWMFQRFHWRYPFRWAGAAAMVPVLANVAWQVVPIRLYDNDLLGQQVAHWYRDESGLAENYPRVIAASPMVYFSLDISITSRQRSLEMNQRNIAAAPPGTFLVWDPVFGPLNSDAARVVTSDDVARAGWIPCRTFEYAGKTWEAFVSPQTISGEPTSITPPQ
jgi:hypothetical protein